MENKRVLYYKTAIGKKKIIIDVAELTPEIMPEKNDMTIGQMSPGYIGGGYSGTTAVQTVQKAQETDESDDMFESANILKANAIAIPDIESPPPVEHLGADELKITNIKYPLIPREPKKGEQVYAYAHIVFDKNLSELVYYVVEPQLNAGDRIMLNEIKEFIQEKLDVNFAQVRKTDAVAYIANIFDRAARYFKVTSNVDVLKYYVIRDFIGLEAIEPLMQDKNIEDISCDGVNIPIYLYHRDTKLGSLRTNLMFTKKEELDSFANKLAERCGKTISVAKPLLDGTLPDGSRIQATLGSDIARHGSNFTIRMFTEKPLTPVDMINFGTCDLKLLAYMWFLIEHESSFLICGGTASGKTSLLNVLSLFIKPQLKIVSIEDTAELKLPHSHWVPEVARTAISEEGKVDMFELLRESLRQRPDYIIVGEVRGKEAYVLFQQMAVGHAGLSTIHAENFPKLMDRLTTQPISLPPNLIQNLDVIIFIKRMKRGKIYSRRISEVIEILGYRKRKGVPIIDEVIKWDPKTDKYRNINKSAILRKIADTTSMTEADIKQELINRAKVLKWALVHSVKDYRKFAAIINLYYVSPEFLLSKIGGGA